MVIYQMCYCREMRCYFEIEAASEEEAYKKAGEFIESHSMVSLDESDDPGEVLIDDVYEEQE